MERHPEAACAFPHHLETQNSASRKQMYGLHLEKAMFGGQMALSGCRENNSRPSSGESPSLVGKRCLVEAEPKLKTTNPPNLSPRVACLGSKEQGPEMGGGTPLDSTDLSPKPCDLDPRSQNPKPYFSRTEPTTTKTPLQVVNPQPQIQKTWGST